jgi:hypothetical protein
MMFMGILGGLALAALFVRRAMLTDGSARAAMAALAVSAAIGAPILAATLGTRIVRLLTRSCRGRPIQLRDVHIVRNGQRTA